MPIKVLIIDDSPVVRSVLSRELAKDPEIVVVGTAQDPLIASEKIEALQPDVLTLDIELPRMDGLTFLRGLMRHHPLPVIVISAFTPKGSKTAMDALEIGAVEILQKPGVAFGLGEMAAELIGKIKAAASAKLGPARPEGAAAPAHPAVRLARPVAPPAGGAARLIAIGASTGGTQAIQAVLTRLPENIPPIVIVQHMPPGFTLTFSERLNSLCAFAVKEAAHGDAVQPGRALVAPGGKHMSLLRQGTRYIVEITDGPKVSRQKPSVEVLFQSVATYAGGSAIGVMLTGMGGDGAEGMLAMRKAGARTIAQDEASCVVFGMPKEAIDKGGVEQVVPLGRIAEAILKLL
jgi:two-component system chemotaxis response regulator CheB